MKQGLMATYRDWNCSIFTSIAESGKKYQIDEPLSHVIFKKVLSILLSYSLPYVLSHTLKKILNTSECNWGYGSPIDMGIISEFSSMPQLGLSKISS